MSILSKGRERLGGLRAFGGLGRLEERIERIEARLGRCCRRLERPIVGVNVSNRAVKTSGDGLAALTRGVNVSNRAVKTFTRGANVFPRGIESVGDAVKTLTRGVDVSIRGLNVLPVALVSSSRHIDDLIRGAETLIPRQKTLVVGQFEFA
jgi:hypothetical protein